MPSTRELSFAALSFALGAWTFFKTQEVTKDTFPPLVEACMDPEIEANDALLVPFEGKLGFKLLEPFVCLITQFLHELVETSPQGLLVWGATLVAAQPVVVLMTIEAGRVGAWGLVRYPIVIGLLYQVLGISVIFPALWVPSYCLGHGTGGVSSTRAYMSVLLLLPGLILSILTFTLDVDTYAWTVCVGILGGPALALAPVLVWGVGVPGDKQAARTGAVVATLAYAISGMLAFIGWVYLLYVTYNFYEFNVEALWKDLWTDANASVKFMAIDATALWLGALIYIVFRKGTGAVEVLFLTPFFGPGSACALSMVELELESVNSLDDVAKPKNE